MPLCRDIETDLRLHVHSAHLKGTINVNPTKVLYFPFGMHIFHFSLCMLLQVSWCSTLSLKVQVTM
jgi:hypothetical protein